MLRLHPALSPWRTPLVSQEHNYEATTQNKRTFIKVEGITEQSSLKLVTEEHVLKS